LTAIVITFFRRTTGYSLFDHKRKEEIWEEMKVEPVYTLRRYKHNRLRHVTDEQQLDAKSYAEF